MVNIYQHESSNARRRLGRLSDRTYVFFFGAYGWTVVMTSARSLDDALENAADWLAEHAPGIFCDDSVREEYDAARAEGLSEEKAQERAEQDTTSVCSGNHYIASHEWTVWCDPDRDALTELCQNGVEVW